jgi:hypothetical protein
MSVNECFVEVMYKICVGREAGEMNSIVRIGSNALCLSLRSWLAFLVRASLLRIICIVAVITMLLAS